MTVPTNALPRSGALRAGGVVAALLAALMLLALPAQAQDNPGARLALVIGNAAYRHTAPLATPTQDARAVADVLRRLGFTVTLALDLDRAAMVSAARGFGEAARGAELALVYYAGHGMQLARGNSGENYLMPVSARLADVRDAEEEAVPLSRVMEWLDGAAVRIVVLDACRDNPLAAQARGQTAARGLGRGLARLDRTEHGSLIVFSTEPGNIALDSTGLGLSPFAAALVEHLAAPGLEIRQTLTRVREAVRRTTGGLQTPWSNDGLLRDVFLAGERPATPAAPAASQTGDATTLDLAFWTSVQGSGDPAEMQAYLDRFPNGAFAALARARLDRLRAIRPAPAPPTAPAAAAGAVTALPGPPDRMAAPGRPGWTRDARTGCLLWNTAPVAGQVVAWSGPCRDGIAWGEGTARWRLDDVEHSVTGTLVAGLAEGRGEAVAANGAHYSGTFLHGVRSGHGVLLEPGGARYEGDFAEDRPHGRGVAIAPDGTRYEGSFVRGAHQGSGVVTWPNGQRYEGGVADGILQGHGVYSWPNGERLEGEFVAGVQAGRGTHIWANGQRYEGEMRAGLPHGLGIGTWADGQRYEGAHAEGRFHGQGALTYPNGSRIEGIFDQGNLPRRGAVSWPSGQRYEGELRDGLENGRGVARLADGARYEGSFRNGLPHGQGTLTQAGGQRLAGTWTNGCLWAGGTLRHAVGASLDQCRRAGAPRTSAPRPPPQDLPPLPWPQK